MQWVLVFSQEWGIATWVTESNLTRNKSYLTLEVGEIGTYHQTIWLAKLLFDALLIKY